jgi:hypothetical protein
VRAVNLLPRDEPRQRLDAGRIPLVAAAGAVVLVSLGGFMLAHSASKSESQARTEESSVRALIARLPKTRTPTISTSAIALERAQRIAVLTIAMRDRLALDKLLRNVSLVLPKDAWLTGFKAAAPAPSSTTAGATTSGAGAPAASADQGVTIEGATYSQDGVARVLSRLSLIPALVDVQLTSSAIVDPSSSGGQSEDQPKKKAKKKTKRVVTFTITASVRPGASS